MERVISHIRPVIEITQNIVASWRFRVTLLDTVSALDEFEFQATSLKPLNDWAQKEVLAFINNKLDYCRSLGHVRITPESDPQTVRDVRLLSKNIAKITRLYELMEQRKRFSELSTFSMDSLKE